MFFLFNKAKMISYGVAVFTVIALFLVANYIPVGDGAVEVAANVNRQTNEIREK